ncbi:hypothetical protein UY3_00645 [Chelonia mydas]|uniref:Uncharacterized protein n=1 Tax=Chelonia mydas TaxID=8469 RepID=M7C1K3_CHEMY|nr:hypothetical protein UY3_00645 [Chelonia mydas]
MFEEIEALDLTPVAQGEDDLLPANLDLGDLSPPLFSPCSLPLTAASAPTSEEPLDSSIDPAADGTPLTIIKPAQVTAGTTRPWAAPVGAEQSTSFLGGGSTEDNPPPDAVATKSTIEPAPGITESSLPTPSILEPDREAPPSSCLPPETQNLASAPAPALTPIQFTSCSVIATPGAVSFPFPTDDPQGAAFLFPYPDPLGAAIFPPPHPIAPGFGAGLENPAHQAPRLGFAPCLPVLVGHGAAPRAPPGNNWETVTPPPHEVRGTLQKFLEDARGSCNKVQLALQRWGDFSQILRATRALMGEGKGTGKRDAAAYWRVRVFREQLLTYGMGQGLLRGPLGDASVPALSLLKIGCSMIFGVILKQYQVYDGANGTIALGPYLERAHNDCMGAHKYVWCWAYKRLIWSWLVQPPPGGSGD